MSHRLPVTLVGGFLGAGKTSLLHHFVSEHQGGYLAILVENPGALNLDAKALGGLCGAMRRSYDVVLAIPNGTEREQVEFLGARLRELSEAGRFERVLIEVGGATNAAGVARYFEKSFAAWAEIPLVVCVVDALDFYRSGKVPSVMADFQKVQIQEAGLLVLNKCDLVSDEERQECTSKLRSLNRGATIIETAYAEIPPESLTGKGTLPPAAVPAHDSEADVLGSVLYRAHRPFHPARFLDWFESEHPGLLRVKGMIWLATRNLLVGGVSRTRWQNACGPAGIWWAALPREEWPEDAGALTKMQETWREPYGDRRQELVLMGEVAQLKLLAKQLDGCLLTAEEYARPVAEWKKLPDPFPEWDLSSD